MADEIHDALRSTSPAEWEVLQAPFGLYCHKASGNSGLEARASMPFPRDTIEVWRDFAKRFKSCVRLTTPEQRTRALQQLRRDIVDRFPTELEELLPPE